MELPESARNLVWSEALTDFYDDELRKCCDPDDDHHKFRWVRQKDIRKMNMQSKEDLMNVRLTMLFTRESLNVKKLMVVPLSPTIAVKEGTTSEATRSRSPSWCAAA